MNEETDLDRLHGAIATADDAEAARRAFYAGLAASLLVTPLAAEPAEGAVPEPELFELPEGKVALAFDTEARLAAFLTAPAAYGAMPGRDLARLLAARGAGILLNGEAPSASLLPPDAMAWLAATLDEIAPPARIDPPARLSPPPRLPPALIAALEARLARSAGLAARAVLAGAGEGEGARPLLALIGAAEGAEGALAGAVAEALHFAGLEKGTLDVAFLPEGGAAAARLARIGLVIELPEAEAPEPDPPSPPGSGPAPPRLV